METIIKRWQNATKIQGSQNAITLADGTILHGVYTLCEDGSVTPSHDVFNGFAPSQGFPTDANGATVNDRDYQRDRASQEITRNIASCYDSRAIQSPVIISQDGIVLSGNGRTMAGNIAARENTDGAYIAYLRDYSGTYGLTLDDVTVFHHPRLVFVLDDTLPYTAATFARFNSQEMKSQNKTEQAIKYGKLVDDGTFGRIISTINAFETLSDFYGCTEAATMVINDLCTIGVISSMAYDGMFDGDGISAAGRETLENVLIGKAFASDPDAARKITSYKNVRRSVIIALAEVSNNLVLGDAYTLSSEISQAIGLCYQARKEGDYKDGERVSEFARQMDIFGGTVADYQNEIVLLFADVLNDKKDAQLKKLLAVYNHQAKDAANGQTDIFAGGNVKTKAEILEDVRTLFAKGSTKEQKTAISDALEARLDSSLFLTDRQIKNVVTGSYVEFRSKADDIVICKVDGVKKGIAYLSGKGGIKFWATVQELTPTTNHALSIPSWISEGVIITDGTAHQRIEAVTDGFVILEWINGGYFELQITDVLRRWQPSELKDCEIIEAA